MLFLKILTFFKFLSKDTPNTREVIMANKVSKTTRKRTKNLKKVKRLVEVFIFSNYKKTIIYLYL